MMNIRLWIARKRLKMAEFFVLIKEFQNPFEEKSATVYVKEGSFFRSQGGITESWGKNWKSIDAKNVEDARLKGYASVKVELPFWMLSTRVSFDGD